MTQTSFLAFIEEHEHLQCQELITTWWRLGFLYGSGFLKRYFNPFAFYNLPDASAAGFGFSTKTKKCTFPPSFQIEGQLIS